jgi:peptidyl-prolyl cis-trans isomerase C
MNIARTLIVPIAAALSLAAAAQTKPDNLPAPRLAPDAPLVVEGNLRVEAADFDGNLLRIPEDKRAAFAMSQERVSAVVDNIFIARSLARKAQEAGLDKDPAVQARMKQVQEAFLADLYVRQLEKDAQVDADLERRARELYAADKDKYMTDEEVHVEQVLIGLVCRTRGAARDLARKALEEARAGASFTDLATKYSDPGEKAYRGGDLGTGPVKRLVEPVREALAKMKPGDISEPVESQFGIHILKLIERKPATVKPFDAVKAQIMAQEKARLQKVRVDAKVGEIRNSATVVIYRDNVE